MIARLRALWRGIPDWIGPRIDYAASWANDTHQEDEQEWRYDNREQAHMRTCRMCNPEVQP